MTRPAPHFAVCPRGLEEPLQAELRALGAPGLQPTAGGCGFGGPIDMAWKANLYSRIASRVLLRMGGGSYRNEDELYERARAVPWESECSPRQRLRVDVTAHRSPLQSLQFATLRVKDAVVDRARDQTGERPDIDRHHPEVQVLAHLREQTVDFYLDLSGEALFKRGWRADKGEAPIKENLAAGLLHLCGWTPGQALLDPFCGSGTIAIEAASMASRLAPGLGRGFALERLAGFDRTRWNQLREQARSEFDPAAPLQVTGRDISTQVLAVAESNARRAGLAAALQDGRLRFEARDSREGAPPDGVGPGLIVTNPPYGEQSSPRSASVASLMADYATRLKRDFAGWQAWLISSDRGLPGQMRLRESRKIVLFNGPLECRFFRFELVAGSHR